MEVKISQKNLFIKPKELEKLFQSIGRGEEKYRVILLLVASGCRPGEACSLNIKNIIVSDCSQFYVDNTKCKRRDLKIVPKWVAAELKAYIQQAYADNLVRDGYIFPTSAPRKRACMGADAFQIWFSRRRKELGLNDVVDWIERRIKKTGEVVRSPQMRLSAYSLRRYFATQMGVAGQDQRVIAMLMGHLDTRITCLYQDKLRMLELAPKAVESMPRLFGSGQVMLSSFL